MILRRDPLPAYRFRVEIDHVAGGLSSLREVASCAEVTGLSAETEIREYREGGNNAFVHRFAGATRYPPLVLRRGLSLSDELWSWHRRIAGGDVARRSGCIYLLDAAGHESLRWDFYDAFPVRWTGPELRAGSTGLAFESVELAHRGLQCRKLVN